MTTPTPPGPPNDPAASQQQAAPNAEAPYTPASTPFPQSPQPAFPPAQPPHAPVPGGGGRGIGLVVVAVAVSLVVGLGAGFLFFGGDDADGGDDLTVACRLADGLADIDFLDDAERPGLEDPELWHLQAMGSLLTSHGYSTDDDDLVELGRNVQAAFARYDVELMEETFEEIQSEHC